MLKIVSYKSKMIFSDTVSNGEGTAIQTVFGNTNVKNYGEVGGSLPTPEIYVWSFFFF